MTPTPPNAKDDPIGICAVILLFNNISLCEE